MLRHLQITALSLALLFAGSAAALADPAATGAMSSDNHATSDNHMATGSMSGGAMTSGKHKPAGAMATGGMSNSAMSSDDHSATGVKAPGRPAPKKDKKSKKKAAETMSTDGMASH